MDFKRFFIRSMAGGIRALTRAGSFLCGKLAFMPRGGRWIGRSILSVFIFPTYKLFYFTFARIVKIFSGQQSKFFAFINKNYVLQIVMIVLVFVVVTDNLNAEELRQENYGEQTIIYALISKEDYDAPTEERLVVEPQTRILSYLDKTGVRPTAPEVTESEQSAAMTSDLTMITQGGMALIRPNYILPITPNELPQVIPTERSGKIMYAVKSGDTLSSIATRFGISVQTILWSNDLGPRSLIRPGDELTILPTSGISHTVKKNETILKIAGKYDVSPSKIIEYNHLLDSADIKIGQELIIPGGRLIVAPSASSASLASRNTPTIAPITNLFIPPTEKVTASGFLWPTTVRRISQYYSWRHKGLDIAGPVGTPLLASDDGVVILSGWSKGYGYNVLIDHGNGYRTRYAHASKLHVAKGDTVVKGQQVANMGSTGWSTGPHIHFEVIYNGVLKNPLAYIK